MKRFLLLIIVAAIAAAAGWFAGHVPRSTLGSTPPGERKILYYQSPMHPWVKSDKPGKCTVCGMTLVPIFEGSPGLEANSTDLVLLPDASSNVASIRTDEVRIGKLRRTLRFAGMIDDDDSRHRILSAYTAGRVEKLFANFEGAEVVAGEPLALFYSRELLSAAREYTLAGETANPALKSAGKLKLRQFGLTEEQITKVAQRAPDNLFFDVLAPMTGTIVKRYVYEGQYVAEGEKLFEIADFTTMWLQFIAYEQDIPFLSVGQPVEITLPSLPGRVLTSTIRFINPNLDDMTRSARVRVEVTNPTSPEGKHREHELLHKTYAEATVSAEMPDVLTVPRTAVIWSGRQPRVYVEQAPGTYQQRWVKLGRAGDDVWEVVEGLKAGERVVVSGNMLIDGQSQLNSLAAPQDARPPATKEMTRSEHDALSKYLSAVADLGQMLALDDLPAYRVALSKLPPAPAGLPESPPAPGADLATTRKLFQPFSDRIAAYASEVRGSFPDLRVYRCPMSETAAEGMPTNAGWIQFSTDVRNPYLGKQMLTCGTEVK